MKCLIKIIIALIICFVLVAGALLCGYFFIKNTYGIDLIKTVQELNALLVVPDESVVAPNKFSSSDMVDLQTEVNESVEQMITYAESNGYVINFDDLPSEMRAIIKLTDKQIGAFAETVIKQEYDNKITIGENQLGINVCQIDFSSFDGKVLFNAVVKVNVDSLKENISDAFPFGQLKGLIPSNFYISSTVLVSRDSTPFSYSVEHYSFGINQLTGEDSEDLFHTLDLLTGIGSCENLNVAIGNLIVGSLIGGENVDGLGYALKDIGATDYAFTFESDGDYFSILR